MIKFRYFKNITLILIPLLMGAGVTAVATPNNSMASQTTSTSNVDEKIIELREIFESFDGEVDATNSSDQAENTSWNTNNRIGSDDTTPFLTISEANAKINYQINKLFIIFNSFQGAYSPENRSDGEANTAWNANNRIGADDTTPFLTPDQTIAKINYLINLLKTIYAAFGEVDATNSSDQALNTAWNANNRIGADDTTPYLTPAHACDKIRLQANKKLNVLKTIFESFAGDADENNGGNSRPDTAWNFYNKNNEYGIDSDCDDYLTLPQANAKINYQINKLFIIFNSFQGAYSPENRSDGEANTAWNANNRIGVDDTAPYLTPDQTIAKINFRINLLKTIWKSFAGEVYWNTRGNGRPDTAWNDNNGSSSRNWINRKRLGPWDKHWFLTPDQANDKINYQINKLKQIWQNWGGETSSINEGDGTSITPWNDNNKTGNQDDAPYLTPDQANLKINYQWIQKLEELKATWQSWGGTVNQVSGSNSRPHTAWNDNNKTGNHADAPYLTPDQANAKIEHQRDLKLKTFTDAGWTNPHGTILMSENNAKGTFELWFIIDNGMLKYTLINTETVDAEDADWSAFNTAHSAASDATVFNTPDDINTLIAAGHTHAIETAKATSDTETEATTETTAETTEATTAATTAATNETTEEAKGSVIGIIVIIIVALFTLPPLIYFGFRYIKKRNKTS